jgi:DNA repair exonuclease SbcCD nuclease subunit
MDKLIYIPDPHYGAKPVSRKDNYNKSILSKLEHCFKVAAKNGCVLVIGGDLFDRPNINMQLFIELLMLFEKYTNVKVIILRGNYYHDGSPESSPLTMLGLFMKNVILSDGKDYYDLPTTRLIFADNVTDPNDRDRFLSDNHTNILLTHHIIVKEPVIYKHYLVDELKTSAKYVLIADYHPEQGIMKRDKDMVVFVSTGALARRKNTSHDIDRIPKFAYLSQNGVILKEIPCEKNVFVEKIDAPDTKEDVLENVKQMVELMDTNIMSVNLNDALDIFATKTKVEPDILTFVKERLIK